MTERISDLLADISRHTAPGAGVSRLPFTQEHRAALDTIRGWMEKAGLTVTVDAAGTMIGRREGPPGAPVLLFGSHQDSVRNGGMFDGIMGVLLPVLALGELRDMALPFSVEVLAFADEEGVRFPTALIGPRSLAGNFDPASLELRDAYGISIRQAMTDFGLDPDAIPQLNRRNRAIIGYVETHIEQGPILEANDHPVGLVTSICGIERHRLTLCGEPGHLHSQCPESKGKRHRVTVLNGKGVCVAGNVEEGDDQWEKEEGASRVSHRKELRRKKDKKKIFCLHKKKMLFLSATVPKAVLA